MIQKLLQRLGIIKNNFMNEQRTLISNLELCVGKKVNIKGWVNRIRKVSAKLFFLEVRDVTGLVQVVVDMNKITDECVVLIKSLKNEYCISIEGSVAPREKGQEKEGTNGKVELLLDAITVYAESDLPPFEINTEERQASEELRFTYRYLDLRHERVLNDIKLRHEFVRRTREYFWDKGFFEIETPLLTRGTPEGAREFIVPSRQHQGKFYVLPQSPQQFKQLLMVGGVEKYFQFARCFRDEDQRGDRQPEFTQMDLEMSFPTEEDIITLIEDALITIIKKVSPQKKIQQIPFPRISYDESIKKYGTDHPDIRTDKNDPDLLAFCWVVDFPFFEKTEDGGWTFTHNPFSAPKPEYMNDLLEKKNIGSIRAAQYDVVLNGFEIGGGSIRNHLPKALRAVFEIMGFTADEIDSQFGHMLKAFSFGAPPHGGIAWGVDRIVAILANEPNIREVIPFPKTSDARDLMMDAPGPVSKKALDEAGIISSFSQPLFDKIINELKRKGIHFECIEHAPVETSEDAARVCGARMNQAAKSIVVKNKEKSPTFYLAVIPGDVKLDWNALADVCGEKAMTMATPEEVESVSGVQIGAVPPFGHLFVKPIKMIIDTSYSTDVVFMQPGRKDATISMKLEDLKKVIRFEEVKISK